MGGHEKTGVLAVEGASRRSFPVQGAARPRDAPAGHTRGGGPLAASASVGSSRACASVASTRSPGSSSISTAPRCVSPWRWTVLCTMSAARMTHAVTKRSASWESRSYASTTRTSLATANQSGRACCVSSPIVLAYALPRNRGRDRVGADVRRLAPDLRPRPLTGSGRERSSAAPPCRG